MKKKTKRLSSTRIDVVPAKTYTHAVDAKKVKAARIASGQTQAAAARRIGWSVQRWSDFENMRRPNPRIDTLLAVCKVLGCGVTDLLRNQ